jgi:hypothetical protein
MMFTNNENTDHRYELRWADKQWGSGQFIGTKEQLIRHLQNAGEPGKRISKDIENKSIEKETIQSEWYRIATFA